MSTAQVQGNRNISNDLNRLAKRNKHLKDHLSMFKKITGKFPKLIDSPSSKHETRYPNVLYPVGDVLFTHIYGAPGQERKYYAIEPNLPDNKKPLFNKIQKRILDDSIHRSAPSKDSEYSDLIEDLLQKNTVIKEKTRKDSEKSLLEKIIDFIRSFLGLEKVEVTKNDYNEIRYRLNRDIIGLGPLEPILRDPANEDIHVVKIDEVFVEHDVFGLMETNIDFGNEDEYDRYIRSLAERIGNPVSDSQPIMDATLPDGSRLSLVYSDDVSLKGPSMTIRQHEETPLTMAQITEWGTFSPMAAAYIWMALENDMSVAVVGETASGKTTSLNAATTFIPPGSKIYTAEDTAEVVPPHEAWQQLLTREGEGDDEEGGEVTMFDLVANALRSRPDYIVVGEVRGAEGQMVFQAAQTGHPVMLTFHASDIKSLIQRFTSDPINVPQTFMDNLNIVVFQNYVKRQNEDLRRVTSVQEIEGYSKEYDGVVTREVFEWDPVKDELIFKGMNNSYILEEKIAPKKAYEDPRMVYNDLELRRRIMDKILQEGILGYSEFNETINAFQRDGLEGLPFDVKKTEKDQMF